MTEDEFKVAVNRSSVFGPWNQRSRNWMNMWSALRELNPDSLLNIGLGSKNETKNWIGFIGDVFLSIQYFLHLEINGDIANNYKEMDDIHLSNVVVGDVRSICDVLSENAIDFTFWSHGPEHIKRNEWRGTFRQLDRVTTKAIILQCPWGSGYDFMPAHISKNIQEGEFKEFGYTMTYNGEKNSRNGEILAWKVL